MIKQIGALDPNEQAILANWHDSLIDDSFWDTSNDLCGQSGVTCDGSTTQRVSQLYSHFLFYLIIIFSSTLSQKYSIEIDHYFQLYCQQSLQNLEN